MNRKAMPEKIKKRIYQESGMLCPMCGESDVSTFEIHHIQAFADVGKHEEENMILLCSNCHSKVTAGEFQETDIFKLKIAIMKGKHPYINKKNPNNIINFTGGLNEGIVANKVEIKNQNKSIKIKAPDGTIALSLNHRNYVKYLIDRYHEFKKAEVGKGKMNYAIFYGSIKREFGAKWDMIQLNRFGVLSKYLQRRIDKTILGKNQKAKHMIRYSTFKEYLAKHSS